MNVLRKILISSTLFILSAFFSLALAQQNKDNTPYLAMKKTLCFGTCPEYYIKITKKGEVTYKGQRFMPKIGSYTKTLSKEKTDSLFTFAKKAKLHKKLDIYDRKVTDMPTTFLEYFDGKKTKKITDRCAAPLPIPTLEGMIHVIALDTLNWTPIPTGK